MIYREKIENFIPNFEVVGCYIECDGKILILHRQDHKQQGNTWGLPAGKIDFGENKSAAILREVKEETGIEIKKDDLIYLNKVCVVYPKYQFVFHIFKVILSKRPSVVINPEEHKAYQWLKPKDTLDLDLIPDFDECLKISYKL